MVINKFRRNRLIQSGKGILFGALASLLVPTLLSGAEEDGLKWSRALKCTENLDFASASTLADSLSVKTVLRDLLPHPAASDTLIESPCTVFSKDWKIQKQPTTLVFLLYNRYSKIADNGVRTTAFLLIGQYVKAADGKLRLTAKTHSPQEMGDVKNEFEPDFAPYKIRPGEYAFGIREKSSWEREEDGISYAYHNGYLDLFRIKENEIVTILETLVQSYNTLCCAMNDDGVRGEIKSGSENPAVISVSGSRTQGFFDLKKKSERQSAVFKWDGAKYELNGKDPVENINSGS